jgi:soluble lytic murein transglycosylase-like protein
MASIRFQRAGRLFGLVAAMALFLPATPVVAAQTDFAKILASSDKGHLTEWARRYEHGEGVPKSVDRAIRLYCKAAKAGHAEAQYFLGYLYAHGRGVKRDDALAAAWFRAAAKSGDRHARNMLKLVRSKPRPRPQCLLSDGLPVGAERKKGSRHPAQGPIADLVRTLAPQYRLDPDLVLAVVEMESNFDPTALSHKNAQGLMQLIPATAERFGVDDVWDPEQNLRGGMSYLRWLLDHFDGDIKLALAGYNAGEQAVRRYRGIPPYAETREYVERISRRLNL